MEPWQGPAQPSVLAPQLAGGTGSGKKWACVIVASEAHLAPPARFLSRAARCLGDEADRAASSAAL